MAVGGLGFGRGYSVGFTAAVVAWVGGLVGNLLVCVDSLTLVVVFSSHGEPSS